MQQRRIEILLLVILLLITGVSGTARAEVKIIFDTDMDTDCDDAGALAILHALADRGEAEILATVVSSHYPWSVPCVAAINRYYGRSNLPIGAPKSEWADTGRRSSRYAKQISEELPTRWKSNDDAPDAVEVYRRVLAAQPDDSVVVVTVGYLTNIRDLLASRPDAISSLDGRALVAQKVRRWVCMGGRYPEHLNPGVFGNFKPDPTSAVIAVRDWPKPIYFSGSGEKIGTGGRLRETPIENPVRRVYELYLGDKKTRPSWDPIAVLFAVRERADCWKVHTGGHNHIFDNGTNQWREGPATNHHLVEVLPETADRLRETLDGLMVPPLPGQMLDTPVVREVIDPTAFEEWHHGMAHAPNGNGADRGPQWVLWTDARERTGHSGLTFGIEKKPGPRHLRIGFKEAIPVGSVLTRGSVRLSVLKDNATYPGDLAHDAQWIEGRRPADGSLTTAQASRDECVLWVFPPGTTTRALRFTHVAAPADATYEGWLGGAVVLRQRLIDLARLSQAASTSNNRHAGKVINGMTDSWNCWANTNESNEVLAAQPVISAENPEWIQLTWTKPVRLNGLIAIWTGFGTVEVQSYNGPEDVHPRDCSNEDWTTIASRSGFESGYPATLWPNYIPFGHSVTTRSIRLRITDVTPARHPHVIRKPADGRRVWLGEVMAVKDIANDALEAPDIAGMSEEAAHAPIPIRFTLPEAGYVTLVIEDSDGVRIRNLVSETWFPAGDNVAWWDGTHDLDRDVDAAKHGLYNIPARFVKPGDYIARGLWRKEIEAFYEFAVYASGDPPWSTPDHTGAWLANHSPPSAAVFVPASHSPTREPAVLLGCFVTEGPDGMAWVDLNGRKRGGMKWIGGNWTAAPYLGRDTGPNADPYTAAFVASAWETSKKSGIHELRINALVAEEGNRLRVRPVVQERLDRWGELSSDSESARNRFTIVRGVAAYNGVVACSVNPLSRVLFVEADSGRTVCEAAIEDPRGLVYDMEGRLLVLSGKKLLRLERPPTPDRVPQAEVVVSEELQDPFAVAIDGDGNLYVSDHGSSHQVKVFSPRGKLLRRIGEAGPPQAGPYNPLHMNHPAGLAVDSQSQLWVTENDFLPKRVSVWSLDGKLIRAFYGPAKYGGGGMLDAHDKTRFLYADESRGTLEFRLDWDQGRAELGAVLYRKTPESMELAFRSAAPETALVHNGRRYFSNCYNSNPTGGRNTAFLFIERGGVAQPVAGVGMANEWPVLKTEAFRALWPESSDPDGDKWFDNGVNQALFIWCDTNEDARAQPVEIRMHHVPVRGITTMDDLSFCIASAGERAMRLPPADFSPGGVPNYDFGRAIILAEGVQRPMSSGGCQVLADDSGEAVITLGVEPFHSHSICGVRDGKPVWSYPSPWPGLHASHHAAKPDRPGQIIGTTRLLGGFVHPRGAQVGPLWAINGNMGNLYLFTRDGLFVATVFEDVRQGKLWKMSVAQRGMNLRGISLHDENFWPTISQTPEGQIYLVDGSYSSLVRLEGLETLRPIAPATLHVTPKLLAASTQYVLEKEALRQKTFGRGVLKAALRTSAPRVDGSVDDWAAADWVDIDTRGAGANFNSNAKPYNIRGGLAASGDRLYAVWDTGEGKLLENSGEIPNAPFKTGGALDLMLGTNPQAGPQRRKPIAGDLRFLVTRVDGQTRATLYRQVVPGTAEADKVPFSSPWRTVAFDRVEDVSDQIELADDGEGHYEVSVPLNLLGLRPQPGMKIRGDIGILRGNGTETTARSYWSNKASGITADVPSEAALTPHLWGTIEWQ